MSIISTQVCIISTQVSIISTQVSIISTQVSIISTQVRIISTQVCIISTQVCIISTQVSIISTGLSIISILKFSSFIRLQKSHHMRLIFRVFLGAYSIDAHLKNAIIALLQKLIDFFVSRPRHKIPVRQRFHLCRFYLFRLCLNLINDHQMTNNDNK